ncbi:MAG: hypothetical protein WC707_00650 [Candidatus Babeliaceae bacterium]|jgi:hypothetical protein
MKALIRLLLVAACVFFALDIVSSIGPSKLFRRGERALQQVPSQPALCPPQVPGLLSAEQMTLSPAFQLSLQQRLAGLKTQNFQPIMPSQPFAQHAAAFDMMKRGGGSTTTSLFSKNMAKAAALSQKRGYHWDYSHADLKKIDSLRSYATELEDQIKKIQVPAFLKAGAVPLMYVAKYSNPDVIRKIFNEELSNPSYEKGDSVYTVGNILYKQNITLSALAMGVAGKLDMVPPRFPKTAETLIEEKQWHIGKNLKDIAVPNMTEIAKKIYYMKFPIAKKGWFGRPYTKDVSLAEMGGSNENFNYVVMYNIFTMQRAKDIEKLIQLKKEQTSDSVELQGLDICNQKVDEVYKTAESNMQSAIQDILEKNKKFDPQIYAAINRYVQDENFKDPVDQEYFDSLSASQFTKEQEKKIKKYVEEVEDVINKWQSELNATFPHGKPKIIEHKTRQDEEMLLYGVSRGN